MAIRLVRLGKAERSGQTHILHMLSGEGPGGKKPITPKNFFNWRKPLNSSPARRQVRRPDDASVTMRISAWSDSDKHWGGTALWGLQIVLWKIP